MRNNLRYAALSGPAASGLQFAHDVLAGLGQPRKSIPGIWLHDHRGSQLFEEMTRVPEYYPARAEILILQRCAGQIASLVGPDATVIELGSGSSRKTAVLIGALRTPRLYVPIDLSAEHLEESARRLQATFPDLPVRPMVGDFTRLQTLPDAAGGRCVLFFPGSTVGNFAPDQAGALMRRLARAAGEGALLIIGADSTQERRMLLPAYDDSRGITAAFNKNLLSRVNRELEADFQPDTFRHEARFDAQQQRIEMHLVSLCRQDVTVLGRRFHFETGESIHTENSYKHGLLRFQAMTSRAGWTQRQLWTDSLSGYALHVLERTH